jgi:signal transduction histidine kinase
MPEYISPGGRAATARPLYPREGAGEIEAEKASARLDWSERWGASTVGTGAAPCLARESVPAVQTQVEPECGTTAARHCTYDRLEAEIKRIACALHDESGQTLTLVHLKLAQAMRRLPSGCASHFDEVTTLLTDLERQLRNFSHELRPPILDDFGLVPAVEFLAESFSQRKGIAISVKGSTGGRLGPSAEIAFYRAVQEALTNAGKHARATRITIQFRRGAETVTCVIRDDGIGFDMSAQRRRGLGLIGMRERVEILGGSVAIESRPGKGMGLVIKIPVG